MDNARLFTIWVILATGALGFAAAVVISFKAPAADWLRATQKAFFYESPTLEVAQDVLLHGVFYVPGVIYGVRKFVFGDDAAPWWFNLTAVITGVIFIVVFAKLGQQCARRRHFLTLHPNLEAH